MADKETLSYSGKLNSKKDKFVNRYEALYRHRL